MRARRMAVCVAVILSSACGSSEERPPADSPGASSDASPSSVRPTTPMDTVDAPAATIDSPVASAQQQPQSQAAGAPVTLPSTPVAGVDTVHGTVALLGAAIDSRVVVQTSAGPIAVIGDLAPAIGRLLGAVVWVQGPLSVAVGRSIPPRQIAAQRFEVREVAGVPALDGTLREQAGAWTIVGARGGTRLTSVPAGLRELVGRRVWVTLTEDGAVGSFGPIE